MYRQILIILAAGGGLAACHVNKAPGDVNAIQVWFWDNYDPSAGTDAQIAAAVVSYDKLSTIASVKGLGDGQTFMGTLSTALTSTDLTSVMLNGVNNPATASPGLLEASEMPCTLDQIEPLLYDTDQDKIHSGSYDSYARTYTSSLSAYQARTTETLAWTSTYKPDGVSYQATVNGGLRRIPSLGATQSPFGPILLARTWMPKAATGLPSGQEFKQDYQMEVYYERTPGHTVHTFADWRDINISYDGLPGTYGQTNTLYQTLVLSNDVSWDQTIANQCGKQ